MRVFLNFIFFLALIPTEALAIQGGHPLASNSILARSIISLADASSGNLFRSYCSGAIVGDHAIVTAAHCLVGKDPKQTFVVFGVNGMQSSIMRSGTKIVIPTQYAPYGDQLPNKKDNYDIGILFFDGGLPVGYAPVVMVDPEITQDLIPLQIAGFGLPTRGQLNQCSTQVSDSHFARSEFQMSGGIHCSPMTHDSGGPAFQIQNGKVYLYGIHNWGWHDAQGNPSYAVDTRISFYAPWIRWLMSSHIP